MGTSRHGLKLIEVVCVMLAIALLVALLLPAVLAARRPSRLHSCIRNFKLIGLGLHNYHATFDKLPPGAGGTGGGEGALLSSTPNPARSNEYGLSPLVALLPFIDQQVLWEQISSELGGFPAMGPNPAWDLSSKRYAETGEVGPWGTQVPTFLCPQHPPTKLEADFGKTTYVACWGDNYLRVGASDIEGVEGERDSKRGMFARLGGAVDRQSVRGYRQFSDCLDGIANTIAFTEVCFGTGSREIKGNVAILPDWPTASGAGEVCRDLLVDPMKPKHYQSWVQIANGGNGLRGQRWSDGSAARSSIVTVLPPNSPSCIAADILPGTLGPLATASTRSGLGYVSTGTDDGTVISTAGSYHEGGCHVLMTDGAVKFITNTVDAGDSNSLPYPLTESFPSQESPYGVWGALGTANGSENREL